MTVEISPEFKPQKLSAIAILPIKVQAWDEMSPTTIESLNHKLVESFNLNSGIEIINVTNKKLFDESMGDVSKAKLPIFAEAALVGAKLNVQGVLCAQIIRYEESDGSQYGAEKLGQVSFKLWLVDPVSKKPLWTAVFEEGNRPLSENLFEIFGKLERREVYYRSTREIIKQGFEQAASALEQLRASAIY